MQNLRTIRRRIRSVQSTQKITKAMQMVAGAKLRRLQGEFLNFRPYAAQLRRMVEKFLICQPALEHPLLGGTTPEAPAGLVLISSDTGLCGTYNEKVLSHAKIFLRENPSAVVVTIGKKGTRLLSRQGIPRLREVTDWGGRYDPVSVAALTNWLKDLYVQGRVSSWWVAATQFISALRWKPIVEQLLPIERPVPQFATYKGGLAKYSGEEYPEKLILEPDPDVLADELLTKFLETHVKRIFLEAFTAEHSARMIAMKNATENATDMVEHLTLVRNKVRQAAITKELIEVVSGAQAL